MYLVKGSLVREGIKVRVTSKKSKLTKEEKIVKAKNNLISKIQNNKIDTFISRVAYILNHYSETRDSDKKLALLYWQTFQNHIYSGSAITPEQYYDLEPQTSITRARAKIQNEFNLFKSNNTVQRFRRQKQEYVKEEQLSIVPPSPTTLVSCDEGGKNEQYVLVGSVWCLDKNRYDELRDTISGWRHEKGLKSKDEFHFTKIAKHEIELYKEYIDIIAQQSDTISFKAVAFKKESSKKKIDEMVTELYTILLISGLDHEITQGRSSLPRILNIVKDAEEGKDKLTLESQKLELQERIKVRFDGKVELPFFEAAPSYSSVYIQIADLFTGCVGRKLNFPEGNNQKDTVANYFFEKFDISLETFESEDSDFVKIQILK